MKPKPLWLFQVSTTPVIRPPAGAYVDTLCGASAAAAAAAAAAGGATKSSGTSLPPTIFIPSYSS
jgi:hypothetical protein